MKFEFESNALDGSIVFEYDDDTLMLKSCQINGELDELQAGYLSRYFPTTYLQLEKLHKYSKNSKLHKLLEIVSFDVFWEEYGKKDSRLKAERAWKKLNDDEQARAIKYINRYNSILAQEKWRSKLLASSYLNGKLWMDQK